MLNSNEKKKGKTNRFYVIFGLMITALLIAASISESLVSETLAPTPEEQIPLALVVTEETTEDQNVMKCESTEIRKQCNSGVLFELEMAQTREFIEKRQKFPHYGIKYQLTDAEYNLLCRLVKGEATSIEELRSDYPDFSEEEIWEEHYKETLSIASVTLKRTFDEEEFPNDLSEVIFQKNQYSTANSDDKEIYQYEEANVKVIVKEKDITEDIKKAVDDALDGIDLTEEIVTDGAIFFYSYKYISDSEREKRANVKEFIKFGDTVFYRS